MKLADLINKMISQFLPLLALVSKWHISQSLLGGIYILKKKDLSYCELVLIIKGKPVSDIVHYLKILHDVFN